MAAVSNRRADIPSNLYEQVRQDLIQRIASGEFKPGDLLPSEDALCKEYQVSRITVRRAVTDLASSFFVTRRRGVGTIVTRRLPERRVFRLSGYFSFPSRFDTVNLMRKVEPASAEVAQALNIEDGAKVMHIRQLAQRSGETFTVTEAFTPASDDSTANPEPPGRFGLRAERGEQELIAINASALVAQHLEIEPGLPIMCARRILLDGEDRPLRYSISCYHPDRYKFTVDLRPSSDVVFEAAANPLEDDLPMGPDNAVPFAAD